MAVIIMSLAATGTTTQLTACSWRSSLTVPQFTCWDHSLTPAFRMFLVAIAPLVSEVIVVTMSNQDCSWEKFTHEQQTIVNQAESPENRLTTRKPEWNWPTAFAYMLGTLFLLYCGIPNSGNRSCLWFLCWLFETLLLILSCLSQP